MMVHFVRATALLLVVVLASCQGALTPTASPTSSAAAETPGATQLVTPEPKPTPSQTAPAPTTEPTTDPTIEPTVEPTPTPVEASPSQTQGPTLDPDEVWGPAAPLPKGTTITGLGYTYEFIVAGNVAAPKDGCAERTQAHVWTSDAGSDWFDVFTGSQVFGSVEVVIDPYRGSAIGSWSVDCEASPAMWGPTDKSDWYQLDVFGLSSADEIVDGVGLLESYSIVVIGSAADDPDHMGVWTAHHLDGTFERASKPPERRFNETLSGLVATNEAVVGFDGTSTVPAWYSLDFGDTWQNTGFQPPFWFRTSDAEAAQEQVFATGFACCTFLDERVGIVIRSDDGIHWDAGDEALLPTIPQAIVGTDTQLVALGKETYVSRDGIDWHVAAPLPGYQRGDPLFGVAGEELLMVASPSQIWVASLEDLDSNRWAERAATVAMPRVGDSFSLDLSTQCGPFNGPLYFALQMWVPDLADGDWPDGFDDTVEHGKFTLVAEDRLEFTSDQGDVVRYLPTDNPPESFPCA